MRLVKTLMLPVLVFCLLVAALPVGAVSGDVNGDTAVDLADAKYYLYHVMLPQFYPLDGAVDYTGDGIVSSADAVYLMYHTMLPEEYPLLDEVSLPAVGFDPDGKGRIQLTDASRNGNVVTVSFKNKSSTWVTEEVSTLTYTCTDADGTVLSRGSFYLGYVKCGQTMTGQITLPAGTAALNFTAASITYWGIWK